jgi:hypothetical protein
MIGLNDVKSYNTIKGFVNYAHYSKGASVTVNKPYIHY